MHRLPEVMSAKRFLNRRAIVQQLRCVLALTISVFLVACAGDDPVQPTDAPSSAEPHLSVIELFDEGSRQTSQASWTLRDEFAAMAARVPGGFGGVYFDDDQILTILLTSPDSATPARVALEAERFIRVRRLSDTGDRFNISNARIRRGSFAIDDLNDWYQAFLGEVGVNIALSGISVHRNKILLGMSHESQREEIERALSAAQIPPEATLIEKAPQVLPMATLRSKIRPVRGGLQAQYEVGGQKPDCTVGPTFVRETSDPQKGFFMNSHCTQDPYGSSLTHYFQATASSSSNHIGNEVHDPPVFPCLENQIHGCRNSDAAMALFREDFGENDAKKGAIMRPVSRNTDALDVEPSNYFLVGLGPHWSVDGEILEKVGRTTGWTGGQVIDGCIAVANEDHLGNKIGPTIRCSMIVDANVGDGDSGAPVFRIVSGDMVELRGMVWGGYPTVAQECEKRDINGETDVVWCPRFVANNLGGMVMDFDPDSASAHLDFTW